MKGVTDGLLVEPVAVVPVVLGVGVTTTTFVTVSMADPLSDPGTVADSVGVVSDAVAVVVNADSLGDAVAVVVDADSVGDAVAVVVDSDSVVLATALVALAVVVVDDTAMDEELEEMGLPSVTLKGARPSEGYATPL